MGNPNNKGINRIIANSIICPYCNVKFSEQTYNEFNSHIAKCQHRSECNSQESTGNDSLTTQRSFEEKQISLWNKILEYKSSRENNMKCIVFNKNQTLIEKDILLSSVDPYEKVLFSYQGIKNRNKNKDCYNRIINEIFKSGTIFMNSNGIYKINIFDSISAEIANNLHLLGKVLARSIIENTQIKYYFNKIIYKHLVEEEIKFEDLYQIDKDLYDSLLILKKSSNISSFNIYYAIVHNNTKTKTKECFELIENGTKIRVTKDNINDYISKRIEFISQKYSLFTNAIKKTLYEIIPKELITQFTANELELVLNGRQYLNLIDLKKNTDYGGKFSPRSKTIQLFWKSLMKRSQYAIGEIVKTLFDLKSTNYRSIIEILSKRRLIIKNSKMKKMFPYVDMKCKDFGFKQFILELPNVKDENEMNQVINFLCK